MLWGLQKHRKKNAADQAPPANVAVMLACFLISSIDSSHEVFRQLGFGQQPRDELRKDVLAFPPAKTCWSDDVSFLKRPSYRLDHSAALQNLRRTLFQSIKSQLPRAIAPRLSKKSKP